MQLLIVCLILSLAKGIESQTCPTPQYSEGPCLIQCNGNDNCPPEMLCCTEGCSRMCRYAEVRPVQPDPNQISAAVDKPGTCPRPMGFGICVEMCSGDETCPGSQKCCSNGCGRSCQEPERAQEGTCPQPEFDPDMCSRIRFAPCRTDNECRGSAQRCCFNGCGKTCMDTTPTPSPSRVASCQAVRPCAGNLECRMQNMGPPGCTGVGCRVEANCFARNTACPDVVCPNVCPLGHLADENGCLSTSCACNPVEIRTCEIPSILQCGPNDRCEMRPSPCDFPGACFDQPQCVDVCRNQTCDPGTRCRARQVQCFRAPCYPVAECEPDISQPPTGCRPLTCRMTCARYRKDSNKCDICECEPETPPCPICLCPAAPIQTDTAEVDENGCPICDCGSPVTILPPFPPSTCEIVDCKPGYSCSLSDEQCPRDCPDCPCQLIAECFLNSIVCPEWGCLNQCQYGYVVDSSGCKSRSCRCNPVPGNPPPPPSCRDIECEPNQSCELRPTPCFPGRFPCYPQPVCRDETPVSKPGTCPRPMGFGTCVEMCSGDDTCPGSQKCCSNGCGHTCQEPERPQQGTCPQVDADPDICSRIFYLPCRGDSECRGPNEKCCFNGCGNTCMDTTPEPPPPTCQDIRCEPNQRCELLPTPCAPGTRPCYPIAVCRDVPPVSKPGRCARPTGFGNCAQMCRGDDTCPGSQKCCSNGCGRACQDPERPQEEGPCPPPSYGPEMCARIRFAPCRDDSECQRTGQRCCFNGCGNSCTDAVSTPPPPPPTCEDVQCLPNQRCELLPTPCARGQDPCYPQPVCSDVEPVSKPGTCPRATGFGTCVEMCSGDNTCPGSQKCCSNGCGHTCQEPEKPQQGTCPRPRLSREDCAVVTFLPCRGDNQCNRDGQKCCYNGCGYTCMDTGSTTPPAPTCADIQCEPNQRCELFSTPCFPWQEPCYPQPVCRDVESVSKPGTCPRSMGFGICVEMCSGDNTCPGSQKCCSNGCGHSCQEPERPQQGTCPRPRLSREDCAVVTFLPCRGDNQCNRDGQKCCYNGCGYTCMDTGSTTPPAPTCDDIQCEPNQRCELLPTPCAPGQFPCHPQPVCMDVDPVACPACSCPPDHVVDMDALDSDGCLTCQCIPDELRCPIPMCVPCPNGWRRERDAEDSRGCPICGDCIPPENQQYEEPCNLPMVRGPCEAAMQRFAFNQVTRRCERFQYGGCGGNRNNFYNFDQCMEVCERNVRPPVACPMCAACPPNQSPNTDAMDDNGCLMCECYNDDQSIDPYADDDNDGEADCPMCPPCLAGFQVDDRYIDANGCSTCRCSIVRNIFGAPCMRLNCPQCPPGSVRDQRARNNFGCPTCACISQDPTSQQTEPEGFPSRPNCRPCSQCLIGFERDQSSLDGNGCSTCRCRVVTSIMGTPCRRISCSRCQRGFARNTNARDYLGCPVCGECVPSFMVSGDPLF